MNNKTNTCILLRARVIDESKTQQFTDLLKQTNIETQGRAGILHAELDHKEEQNFPKQVAMAMIACPHTDSNFGEALTADVVESFDKVKAKLNE